MILLRRKLMVDYNFNYGKDPRKEGKYKTKSMAIAEMMEKIAVEFTTKEDEKQEETNEKD